MTRGRKYRRESLARHDRERTFNPAFVPQANSRTRRKRKARRSILGILTRKPRMATRNWDLGNPADTPGMGDFVFSRLSDMFEFFRGQTVNPLYWSEKVTAGRDETRAYSEDLFRRRVSEYVADFAEDLTESEAEGLRAAVQADVLSSGDSGYPEGARMLLDDFSHALGDGRKFQFHDTWEWELTEFTHRFLWCLHAIVWAIGQYDANAGGTP